MLTGWKKSNPLEKSTIDALGDSTLKDAFKNYLKRFREVIGNNDIDFTKPGHNLGDTLTKTYSPDAITRKSKFNLIAQNPVDFFKKASRIRFENQKWLRTASAIGGSVIAATVLAQFCFGKITNPNNIVKKQVNNDSANK